MDRIELSQPSNRQSQVPLTAGTSDHNRRQRAASIQSRPSIRIQRWPSNSYYQPRNSNNPFLRDSGPDARIGNRHDRRTSRANTVSAPDAPHIASRDFAGNNNGNPPLLGGDPDVNVQSPPEPEPGLHRERPDEDHQEEEFQSTRRRSSSEPRRGRWSTPPALTIQGPGEMSSSPMPPLTEEASNHRTGSQQRPKAEHLGSPDHLGPPEPGAENRNTAGSLRRLRRASSAAVSRLSPNRNSSVIGRRRSRSPSGWSTGGVDKGEEYDPLMVDFLDVIGVFKALFTFCHAGRLTTLQTLKYRPCPLLQMYKIPFLFPTLALWSTVPQPTQSARTRRMNWTGLRHPRTSLFDRENGRRLGQRTYQVRPD